MRIIRVYLNYNNIDVKWKIDLAMWKIMQLKFIVLMCLNGALISVNTKIQLAGKYSYHENSVESFDK